MIHHLTLDLGSGLVEIVDRIVREEGRHAADDFGRRHAIVGLILTRGGHPRDGAQGGDEPEALRRERDALRKALEAERATRRKDRERHARTVAQLGNARSAVARLSESRAAYRDLALRLEAALLDAPPRADLRGIETRLRQALGAAGFTMPAGRNR